MYRCVEVDAPPLGLAIGGAVCMRKGEVQRDSLNLCLSIARNLKELENAFLT